LEKHIKHLQKIGFYPMGGKRKVMHREKEHYTKSHHEKRRFNSTRGKGGTQRGVKAWSFSKVHKQKRQAKIQKPRLLQKRKNKKEGIPVPLQGAGH